MNYPVGWQSGIFAKYLHWGHDQESFHELTKPLLGESVALSLLVSCSWAGVLAALCTCWKFSLTSGEALGLSLRPELHFHGQIKAAEVKNQFGLLVWTVADCVAPSASCCRGPGWSAFISVATLPGFQYVLPLIKLIHVSWPPSIREQAAFWCRVSSAVITNEGWPCFPEPHSGKKVHKWNLKYLDSLPISATCVLDLGSAVKNLPAIREMRVRSLGGEDPLEEKRATHSSILAWKIPWME